MVEGDAVISYLKTEGPSTVWDICHYLYGPDYKFNLAGEIRDDVLFPLVKQELIKVNYDNTYEYIGGAGQ